MRLLGFIFVSLLISIGISTLDFYLPGTFFTDFLNNNFIETFATLVGLNIAAVIFLIGQLTNIEERLAVKYSFINTKKEIKHNVYFLLSSFIVCLILLIIRPNFIENGSWNANIFYYLDNIFVISLFSLAIFAIFEILKTVFLLEEKDPSKNSVKPLNS